MTHTHAGRLLRGSLLLLFGASCLGACANDVSFFGSDDDGGECATPPPPSGGWCPPAWSCIDGTWVDTAGACPEPACPTVEPSSGEGCTLEGQICTYEYDEEQPCGDEEWGWTSAVECFGGSWVHLETYCQPEPECPTEAPVNGTDCSGWYDAYFCSYEVETSCGSAYLDAHCEWVDGQQIWNASFYDAPMCEDGCGAYDGEVGCAADSACRWLVPGCDTGGPNALTEAGCYPVEDCSAGGCADGQTCETISYNPCHNQACEACAAEGSICL